MTDIFDNTLNEYFHSSCGAFTQVTAAELGKETFNVKAIIRNLLIDHFGENNIPRSPSQERIEFHIYNTNTLADVRCLFSKPLPKREMSIYFSANGLEPDDIWFIFFRPNDNIPWLGFFNYEDWCNIRN